MKLLRRVERLFKDPWHYVFVTIPIFSGYLPTKLYLQLMYKAVFGRWIDFKNPITFSEKLQWLKIYAKNDAYSTYVDKLLVKDYVKSKIGEEYVVPTINIWENVDSIEWESLPEKFVLKTTHGGGGCGVVVCNGKSGINKELAIKKLNKSLKTDAGRLYCEYPYKLIKRQIIAESYLDDLTGEDIKDYKFFCFNGVVRCLKVDFNRFTLHQANYFDRDFNLLDFGEEVLPPNPLYELEKPENFDRMIEISEILSKGIPFLRVDLYNISGKIYFGEMTFFPAGGVGKFVPADWDEKLGSWLKLD